jgi:tetratricopeptide (TPR) repeat protein
MTRLFAAALAAALTALPLSAGVYYSGEQYAELPSRPAGFLVDQRALRAAGVARPDGLPAPLRDDYLASAERLEKLAARRALTADEAADLGALFIRLGKPDRALDVLVPAARRAPTHFRLAANLGSAFQSDGALERAAAQLEEAVRLAPPALKPFERAHVRLVKLRLKEGKAAAAPTAVDDLFGVKYVGDSGAPAAGKMAAAERAKLPADALAVVQQLALWMPADGRLLWQFGELCNAHGDVRAAAAALDGCVTEFALAAPDLRARRTLYRAAADELAKQPGHEQHRGALKVKSSRPLVRAFDEAVLPDVAADRTNALPWPVLAATAVSARGVPTFAKYLEKLDGKTVALTGFMQPVKDELAAASFLLLEYPVGCWFCEMPDPTGLLSVELAAGKTVEHRRGLVKVTGKLVLNRDNPEGYLFELKDARVGAPD